jgi:glycerol uptake facilitator-like aquaporin
MGVFFYVWTGVGANVSFILNNLGQQPGLGNLLQVGLGYGIGIVLALTVCAATSGGHINPCITITFAIFRGFPWKKVPFYIVSQIIGAYAACLMIYFQYKDIILQLEDALIAKNAFQAIWFTPNGIGGAFALYTTPGRELGIVFWNEFLTCFTLALVIFACLDPSNFIASPRTAPWIIGLAYSAAIWGYGPASIALNTARDVGARLMAITIWGMQASGGSYAAIAALTNIPATILGLIVYELLHHDSSRVLAPGQREHMLALRAHLDRRAGSSPEDYYQARYNMEHQQEEGRHRGTSPTSSDDKPRIELKE